MADGVRLSLVPARFDHGAADSAADRLVELAGLIDDVLHRRSARTGQLAGWEGPRRDEFDLAAIGHQRHAEEVADRCRATAARIRRAAASAAAAAAEQARRDLGPVPRRAASAGDRGAGQARLVW
jgi:hypothetical protein